MTKPTLVIAGHDGHTLDPSVAHAVAAARQLAASTTPAPAVHVLVLGDATDGLCAQAATLDGVHHVLQLDHPSLAPMNAATLARQIVMLAPEHGVLLAAHTPLHRAALARAAAVLNAAFLTDVTAIRSDGWTRPVYAGAALADLRTSTAQVLATLRPAAFPVPATAVSQTPCPITPWTPAPADPRVRLLGRQAPRSVRPELSRAAVVVGAGRGMGEARHMSLIEDLADHLGGAVGASRAAVDAGYADPTLQVGQTGKTIAPDLYLAFGISGAIQHVAGIKDARCIVAINKDPDAPIFQVADLGLVGDLFEVLPALKAALPERHLNPT